MNKYNSQQFPEEPVLRVNIADGKPFWDFAIKGRFAVEDDAGHRVLDPLSSELRWRVLLERYEPAQISYTLKIADCANPKDAESAAKRIQIRDFQPRIQKVGGTVRIGNGSTTENLIYQVLLGEFNTEEDARIYSWKVMDLYDCEIVREKLREARGRLEVFDAEYGHAVRLENSMRIVSDEHGVFATLFGTRCDGDHTPDGYPHRRCLPPLQFRVGQASDLIAICPIPLETYLRGVLLAEMTPDTPLEALKSQAVTSRGWAMSNLGVLHAEEPFDVCCDNHCQLFADCMPSDTKVSRAVEDTRGEYLFFKGKLCRTPHTLHCGGHSDDSGNGKAIPYLRRWEDGPRKRSSRKSLHTENEIIRWITSRPDVFCNPAGRENGDDLAAVHSAFRWEVVYSRKELEAIIQQKSGDSIGTLYDIIPLKRSCSGRIQSLEILGSRKNLRIIREDRIRNLLSTGTLNSGCFVVEKDMDGDGIPMSFTFLGAGHGHGAGMCQSGARLMASAGKSYKEILAHYFPGVELTKIY